MNTIGIGAYSIQEAARYSGVKCGLILRWLFSETPLWKPQLCNAGLKAIGFNDLLELRIVDAFRKRGISLQAIRLAINNAVEIYEQDYPFTNRRFATDGKDIFSETIKSLNDKNDPLIDLTHRQLVLDEIIRPSLHDGIVYDDSDQLAVMWHPDREQTREVVLDPRRSFGKPIIEEYGIRTFTLYEAFLAEGDAEIVSRMFEIPVSAVNSASRFEERLSRTVAA